MYLICKGIFQHALLVLCNSLQRHLQTEDYPLGPVFACAQDKPELMEA